MEQIMQIIILSAIAIICLVCGIVLLIHSIKDFKDIEKSQKEYNSMIDNINKKIRNKEFYYTYTVIKNTSTYKDKNLYNKSRELKQGEEIKISGMICKYAEENNRYEIDKNVGKIYDRDEYVYMHDLKLIEKY